MGIYACRYLRRKLVGTGGKKKSNVKEKIDEKDN